MLANYLKIGIRNLLKNKLFTLINILGMAISIASFLVIALFIYDETRFDEHVEDASLKFRVYNDYYSQDGSMKKAAMIPPPILPALKNEYPEVDYFFRLMSFNSNLLFEAGDKKFAEGKGGYADPAVFEMFSLKLVEGDLKTALKEPNDIAISKTLAKKYFGETFALGQTIEVSDELHKVSAVFEDFPTHSHLQLNFFLAMEGLVQAIPERMQSWGWSQFHSYIKLKAGADVAGFENKLRDIAERNGWPETMPRGHYVPHLMPLQMVHLHAHDHVWDIAVRGNIQTVYILSVTAIFILIIAILNFINLSTARAVTRVKEVGVRKTVGAFRTQLIYQFISESVIIAMVALLIGGLLTELVIPGLNVFTEKSIPTGIFLNPVLVIAVIMFALFIGIAAGAYPAFYISGYKPASILSNKHSGKSGKGILRKSLVVLQFILSFFLITASFVVADQHRFMQTMDMGFSKSNLVVLPLRGEMKKNLVSTKNEFSDHPNVISAAFEYGLPGEAYAVDGITDEVNGKGLSVSMLLVDHDYIATLGLELVAGRDFSKDRPSDEEDAFIVNEDLAKLLGYQSPEDVLQHRVSCRKWDGTDSTKYGHVIGVVKNFHMSSLKETITPLVLHIHPVAYATVAFRIKPENVPQTLAHFETTWKKFNVEWPFEYRFIDDNFDKLYKSEQKLAVMFSFFTGFTIFVACLGLFGLVVYSTTQRYKEISIRKVFGAEVSTIVIHLARNYLFLIAIAFIIAIPFSYFVAHQWLQGFAYRIDITPMLFLKAGLLILGLALITVGIQSFKAARSNPINALKEQ